LLAYGAEEDVMNKVLELIPISRLRQEQNEVLGRLAEGPVVLTQYGDAAAVLVDPDQWNQIVEELETWMDSFDALEEQLALATGEDEVVDWEAAKAELDAVQA
jgi:PHD/YefM family antitoxin component YafN of YafNO toxin-antitoxin module